MSVLLVILPVVVVAAVWSRLLVPSIRRVREEQVRQGLFGHGERERLIARTTGALIAMAEREVRLGHFGSKLRSRAWEGAIVQIDHASLRRSSTWRFADGEVWSVDLAALPPRDAPRVVIHSLEQPSVSSMRVEAYVPGRREVTLFVTDAQPLLPVAV